MLTIGSYVDGKYKILNEISRGGMGVVYMAVNEKVNKTWAIKVAGRSGIHDNNMAIQNLAADRKTLVGLNHPHLPSIVDVYENENSMMIVMDYIQGNPLSVSLKESGAQHQDNVILWAKQLCLVLGYLHGNNIIYRDMKPSNIMLKPDGNIVLIDFGATRRFKENNPADTQCLGTIGYAAPEQFGGQGQTDARTDIYCLGATLHHLVTGIDPCRETSFEKIPIRQIDPTLSGGLESIIIKCLQNDKSKRYQSCAELLYDLEHYEEKDEAYQKKQKKRLGCFAVPAILTLLFLASSIFGYAAAENRLNHDYNLKIAAAEDVKLPYDDRVAIYLDAIRLNQTEPSAYLNMIKLFLSGDGQGGGFSREDASIITQLKAGLDYQDGGGYVGTVYPLESLKAKNPTRYEDICLDIGMAYWYDYEVESESYSAAIEWFSEAAPSHPIAGTYAVIGLCLQDIKRFSSQSRTEKMHEAYGQLWNQFLVLENDTEVLADNDTKLLVWRSIVDSVSDKAGFFLVSVRSGEMLELLDKIDGDAQRLGEETKYEEIRRVVGDLRAEIDMARTRINSSTGFAEQREGFDA